MSLTPITIAGLTFSPVVAGAILLCLVLIIGSTTWYWRHKSRMSLQSRYASANSTWTQALTNAAALELLLTGDRYGLVNGQRMLKGASKEALDAARIEWSLWAAQRVVAERTLKSADELNTRFKQRRWWQLSHKSLKAAIGKLTDKEVEVDSSENAAGSLTLLSGLAPKATFTGSKLIADLENNISRVRAELQRIQFAYVRASDADKRLRESISGYTSASESISVLRTRLAETRELPFEPYQERLDEVDGLYSAFASAALEDPLTSFDTVEHALTRKVTTLRNELNRALALYKALRTYRSSVHKQSERVAEWRRTPLKSGFPGALVTSKKRSKQSEDVTFCFAEDDDELNKQLNSAAALSDSLTAFLVAGNVDDFERTLPGAKNAVAAADKIVDEVVQAKQTIDTTMTSLIHQSTQIDIAADAEDTAVICNLYTAQQWRAAAVAVNVLSELHLQRMTTRANVREMLSKLEMSEAALERTPHIFSTTVDEFSADLRVEANHLDRAAQFGRNDWKDLQEQVATLLAHICAEVEASLASRIARESADHAQAIASVASLSEKLADLLEKSGDRWGGSEAAGILSIMAPSVEEVVQQSHVEKQQWTGLHNQATGVMQSLQPAEKLIDSDLLVDAQALEFLAKLKSDIEACSAASYKREVYGADYGAGIYCNILPTACYFRAANVAYGQRRYEQMRQEGANALNALLQAHLESWWLCLQMMSLSEDASTRLYAMQHGYSDYGFEEWKIKRIAETAAPFGSNTSVTTVADCFNVPNAFASKKAKGARATMSVQAGDAPAVKDYERHYAAAQTN